jgi:hypothetical protein
MTDWQQIPPFEVLVDEEVVFDLSQFAEDVALAEHPVWQIDDGESTAVDEFHFTAHALARRG